MRSKLKVMVSIIGMLTISVSLLGVLVDPSSSTGLEVDDGLLTIDPSFTSTGLTIEPGSEFSYGDFTYLVHELTVDDGELEVIDYHGDGGAVQIPDAVQGLPVTMIGDGVFHSSSITSLEIPYTVTMIGSLKGSINLQSIDVSPENSMYASIDGALYDKNIYWLIEFPQGKGGDFTVPEHVTSIKDGAFEGCDELTSLTILGNVTTIESSAFKGCTALESVTIGGKVRTIGDGAFRGCTSLTSLDIGDNVTTLGPYTFDGCLSLVVLRIGKSVWSISDTSFHDCHSLVSIEVDADNAMYSSSDGVLYDRYGTHIIKCPEAKGPSVTIPEGVVTIGASAFEGCRSIEHIDIPDSVITVGKRSFESCISLVSVSIGDDVTTIGTRAFNGCGSLTSLRLGDSIVGIGASSFYGCASLRELILPQSLTTIDEKAFLYCSSLEEVRIPDGVVTVGSMAFWGCDALTTITFGDGVKWIGNVVLANCPALVSITFEGDAPIIDGNQLYESNGSAMVRYFMGRSGFTTEMWEIYDPIVLDVPSAPGNIIVMPGDGVVTMSWDAPSNDVGLPVTSYNVYRGESSDSMTIIASTYETWYVDGGVENDIRYHYHVSAVNANGEGVPSESIQAVPTDGSTPSEPFLKGTSTEGEVVLNWVSPIHDGDSPIEGYTVYRGISSDTMVPIATVVDSEFVDDDVDSDVTYLYSVSAFNDAGQGVRSYDVTVTPEAEGVDVTKLSVAIVMIAIAVIGTGYVAWKGRGPYLGP